MPDTLWLIGLVVFLVDAGLIFWRLKRSSQGRPMTLLNFWSLQFNMVLGAVLIAFLIATF